MIGKVIHGNKLGRQLGFPTANISLNRLKPAPLGVWAVSISGIDNSTNDNNTNTPNGLATKVMPSVKFPQKKRDNYHAFLLHNKQ